MEHDDLDFVRALARGDSAALLAFEHRYRPVARHAFGVAVRRWRPESPVEAEDYVQDLVGHLFADGGRKLRSYQGRAGFGAWFYTVALRYFQRQLARLARDRRTDGVLTRLPERDVAGPERAAVAGQEADRIRAAVAALPEHDRLYVRLFFVEDQNASEVGRTLGKGTSAVRMRKMRILEKLRALLTEGPGQPAGIADSDAEERRGGGHER